MQEPLYEGVKTLVEVAFEKKLKKDLDGKF
ncbi:MAG: hypothetical protein RLZ62_729 [Bacteroidota bacterium]|jgi:hypothetical protein